MNINCNGVVIYDFGSVDIATFNRDGYTIPFISINKYNFEIKE